MPRTIVGVDIGNTGVRAVESTRGSSPPSPRRAHAVPLPRGAVRNGVVVDPQALTTALRLLWKQGRLRSKDVVLTVGGQAVMVRAGVEPWAPTYKDQAAIFAAKSAAEFPVPMDTIYMDHHVKKISDVIDANGSRLRFAHADLIGAHKEQTDTLVAAVTAAGLTIKAVDATIMALARLVSRASAGPGTLDFLAHLGSESVTLAALRDGQLIQIRDAPEFGGARITEAVMVTMQCTFEDAEYLKRTSESDPNVPSAVQEVVASWTGNLVSGIAELVAQSASRLGTPIGRVWLSGGGAQLPGLVHRLKAQVAHPDLVAVLSAASFAATNPQRLLDVEHATGQDLTVAYAASDL